jgi:hypothetical protein
MDLPQTQSSSTVVALIILALLLLLAGLIFLQIYLSKRDNRWFGLILPVIFFCLSIVLVFVLMPIRVGVSNVMADGQSLPGGQPTALFILHLFLTFLVANIPTGLFLLIYFASREKMKRQRELERMAVQDLE